MYWENILKNVITVPKQKLRTSKRPLPDEEDDDCYNWLLRLGDVVAPIVNKSGHNNWILKSKSKVPEEVACHIKDVIQNLRFSSGVEEVDEITDSQLKLEKMGYKLDYVIRIIGELIDIIFYVHPTNDFLDYIFRIELTFAPAPIGAYNSQFPSILPALFSKTKVLSKEDDVEGLINLGILDKSSTYVFIEDYDYIIKSNIDDINMFIDYTENNSLKRWFDIMSKLIIVGGEVYQSDNGIQPTSEAHSKLMSYLDMLK